MRLLFDCETNGLLHQLDRIHCLNIRDVDTRKSYRFRRNDTEDTIEEGVRMLHEADEIIGHNVVRFDVQAIKKVFPWFAPKKVTDTLVLVRIIAPDIKQSDYVRARNGKLPASLIGKHSLEAWGYRLGMHKGSYDADMRAKGLDPWLAWNQEMDDYCDLDVDINEVLLHACLKDLPNTDVIELEHDIHSLCGRMEDNGFPFDVEGAKALAAKLRADYDALFVEAEQAYGHWYAPKAKWQIGPLWDAPVKKDAKPRVYHKPRECFGEDNSRRFWGDVEVPKRPMKSRINPKTGFLTAERDPDAPFCPIKRVEFNPGSRHNIVDRFVTVHDWVPSEFSEAGAPSVNDDVLRTLEHIPIAKSLAELFFIQKLLGMIETGNGAWLKKVDENGLIHPSTNTGGAVTRRCTHSHPNIAQVPSVETADIILPDGKKGKRILYGREGSYGYECRSLFFAPEGWTQVGVDLKGIELRCLAALCAEFDGGELIKVVLSGDPHQYNYEKTGVESRAIAKRLLYALMYGAGDWKLGWTAYPLRSYAEQLKAGKLIRSQFMEGLPALRKAIDMIKKEAEAGYIRALDGGRLKVRNSYSALNTRLQSDGALIAKRWAVFTELLALDEGMVHGWHGDFTMQAFIHDELQNMVRTDSNPEQFAYLCCEAARLSGESFGFACPVEADSKLGRTWAECH